MIDESLSAAVAEVIRTGKIAGLDFDDAEFEHLAVAIAAEQGFVVEGRPLTGERRGLDRIDPLPETAFKIMTVAQFPPSEAEAEFLTSGTTGSDLHGRLLVYDMSLYRLSALEGFRRFCMYDPAPRRFMSLIPSGHDRQTSSLSWMATFVMEEWDDGHGAYVAADGLLDAAAIDRILGESCADGQPLFIMGTSLDFLTLFNYLKNHGVAITLPPGSRAMHTGGAKASGREITRDDLIEDFGALLGIKPFDVIEEFGMTELFSQAYDSPRVTTGPRRLVPVPWMRTRVLDPRTLTDVAEGERGILVHYDLANCHTCVAMMAADTARRVADGFAGISRTPGSAVRGCSNEAAVGTKPV
jgi:hypothetical protein